MSRCASPVTLVEPARPMVFAAVSRPPSPPPPNSPARSASPSAFSIPFNGPSRRLLVASRQRAVFDLHSSSPISPTAVEKTILKTQLDRAKSTKVLIRPGAPARALTDEELRTLKKEEEDSATTSGGGDGPLSPPEEEEGAWVDEPASLSKAQTTAASRQLKPTDSTVPTVVAGSPLRQVVGFAEPSTSPEQSAASHPASASQTEDDTVKHPPARPPFHRSHTAPSTPSISPTSYLSTLLSRQPPSATPPQLDRSPVMGSTTLLAAPSSSLEVRQTVKSSSTWTGDVLATALKVVKAPSMPILSASKVERKRPSGVATTKPPSPASSLPSSPRSRALGKTRSLPSPALPSTSPAKVHQHTPRTIRPSSSVPPLPFALPSPSLSLPSHLPSSSSRSYTRAPPSPPIAPVMSSTDPSALMLHFARQPDMGRKASLGDGWTRVRMPGDPRSQDDDGARRRAVDTSESETETETEDDDDEDSHFGSKSRFNLRISFEGSVFASAGANSAASLTSSASSSLLLSRPPSVTHSRKPSASPDSSPKLGGSAALTAAFSDPAVVPPAPFPSVIDSFVSKDRTAALLAQTLPPPPPQSQHALDLHAALKAQENKPSIDLKQLRREQASRRQAAEEETTTTSASSSEDEETRRKAFEVVLAARARRGKGKSSPPEKAGAASAGVEGKSGRAAESRRKVPVASARPAKS
ncbi:hypothetical protein NBRC10513v2_006213 [Rhodotorula toruloides]|uniref:Uncharacterized protein n=1 Tax=Rhodotorula toruloides TaxID=5286 RepID=A0A0K3CR46_RHOTO|nr:hypothetical protein AAT19DRAFT_11419 [Rhodotorula toruloides]